MKLHSDGTLVSKKKVMRRDVVIVVLFPHIQVLKSATLKAGIGNEVDYIIDASCQQKSINETKTCVASTYNTSHICVSFTRITIICNNIKSSTLGIMNCFGSN